MCIPMYIFMFILLTGYLIQKNSMFILQYFQVLAQEHKHKKRAETALFYCLLYRLFQTKNPQLLHV